MNAKVVKLPTALKVQPQPTDKKFVESEWLYLGLVFSDAEQELAYSFQRLEGDRQVIAPPARFVKSRTTKHLDKHLEGCVYAIETTEDFVTFRFSSMRMLRMWHDVVEAEAIRVASRAAERKASTLKMRVKLASDMDQLHHMLGPIREQYRRTNSLGRICIEALLLEALRKGIH